jgi:diguanylate cyclase (GGDEF)-like protein
MHLDLDLFKAVNDTYGHAAGDQVLQTAARIMVEQTRSEDTVARIGGDEFVLIFEGDRETAKLAGIADRLIRRIEAPIRFEGQDCAVSASIGIARSDSGSQSDPLSILHHADLALYCAKRAGRGRYRFFTPDMLSPQTPQSKFG